jgi:hypothetical protein
MIDPNKPAQIVLRVPQAKRAAYMAAARVKRETLAGWMTRHLDRAATQPEAPSTFLHRVVAEIGRQPERLVTFGDQKSIVGRVSGGVEMSEDGPLAMPILSGH